ncbi:uncharacterized protein LOC125191798 isoform X1 [Salvia hispanica]|uniref:uncharacterized protein LOC125191798 isoform X1 n=2 Tax=Salvia hispanica TaxID=49212 RepID=UPI00200908F0|nr:uncharacterized protein LOC125191798 isoform X1 [Salvia hispanica]
MATPPHLDPAGGRKGLEHEKIKRIDMEIVYLSAEEMRRKTEESERRAIRDQDTQLKKLEGIIKSLIHRPDSGMPKLELLQSYFKLIHEKINLSMMLNDDVFGKKYKIFIFLEDVNKFCLLEPISDSCIISYMWYLHKEMKKDNMLHKFRFVNPNNISNTSTRNQRACSLADRLIGASADQLVLAPCNVGFHWILTVIQPYTKTVFLFDPLSHRIRHNAWKDAVDDALSMFSSSKGENEKKSPTWVVVKAPRQPDSKQCGFYIMQYMREIIRTCRYPGSISLQTMFTGRSYSTSEIDEMRSEWADGILDQFPLPTDQQQAASPIQSRTPISAAMTDATTTFPTVLTQPTTARPTRSIKKPSYLKNYI